MSRKNVYRHSDNDIRALAECAPISSVQSANLNAAHFVGNQTQSPGLFSGNLAARHVKR
jgi:hypothetical protein